MESRRLAPATIRWGQAARTTPQWGLLRPRTIAHAVQPPITLDYWIGWFGARTASGRAAGGFGERNTAARDLARGRRSGEAVPRAPHRPEHLETGRPRLTPLASRTIQPGSLLARLEADASRTTSRLGGHCISTQLRIMEPAAPAAASNNPEGSIRLGRKMWRGPIPLGSGGPREDSPSTITTGGCRKGGERGAHRRPYKCTVALPRRPTGTLRW